VGRQKCSSSAPDPQALGSRFASCQRQAGTAQYPRQHRDFGPAARARCIRHNRASPAAGADLWVRRQPSAANYPTHSRKTGCTRRAPRPNRGRLQPQRSAWWSCRTNVSQRIDSKIASCPHQAKGSRRIYQWNRTKWRAFMAGLWSALRAWPIRLLWRSRQRLPNRLHAACRIASARSTAARTWAAESSSRHWL
jgi:hypothetical protein